MSAQLELHFSAAPTLRLVKTVFVTPCGSERLVAWCAEGTAAERHSFVWSSASRAATVLLLRHAANARSTFKRKELGMLEGGPDSLAASLDRAAREPNWLLDMFGASPKGESNARIMFCRTVSDTRSGWSVADSVNSQVLPGEHISVFVDGAEIISSGAIYELAWCMEAEPEKQVNIGPASNFECAAEAKLACLEIDVRVVILNCAGDAEVTFKKKVENMEATNVTSAAIEVWLDTPYSEFEVEARDGKGRLAPVTSINDENLYKRLKINLPEPIGAFQKGGYSFRYVVQKLFEGPLNWWSLRVREPTARLKLEILDTRFRTLENQFTLHQAEDGHIVDDVVKHSITGSNRGVTISWTSDYPPTGHLFKTYWVGRDPMHVSLPETAPYRSGEATTIALC